MSCLDCAFYTTDMVRLKPGKFLVVFYLSYLFFVLVFLFYTVFWMIGYTFYCSTLTTILLAYLFSCHNLHSSNTQIWCNFVQYTQVYTVVYFYFLPLLFCIIVLSLHMLHLQWISTIFAWTGHSIIFKVIKNKNTLSFLKPLRPFLKLFISNWFVIYSFPLKNFNISYSVSMLVMDLLSNFFI